MNAIEKRNSVLRRAESQGITQFSQQEIRDFVSEVAGVINTHAPNLNINSTRIAFMNALYRNPELKNCAISTVIGAFFQCALYGLDPNDGECYFIPRNMKTGNKLQNGKDEYIKVLSYHTGYQGYLKIYEELGYILDVQLVCKTDEIIKDATYDGEKWEFKYIPKTAHVTPENLKYVFVTARYPNGIKKSFVVFAEEIEDMRKASPSQCNYVNNKRVVSKEPVGVWKDWYGEMAKKSAIRRLRKWIGKSLQKDYSLVDEGIINAKEYGIEIEEAKVVEDETTEWVMDREKAEALFKRFIEQDKKDNPERTNDERKEAYLMEIELEAGHREVKELTEQQYNKLMEAL